MDIKEVEKSYKQIIEAQKERQLTGEEFIELKKLQTLTKRLNELEKLYIELEKIQPLTKKLNELEKEYREVVDYRMSI